MAAKRTAAALRPALNGLRTAPAALRAPSAMLIPRRGIAIQPSRTVALARRPQPAVRHASSDAHGEQLGKTGLYELHARYGAKFVPFGGFAMPVQYSDQSIVGSHNWTREKASLFDVGHM